MTRTLIVIAVLAILIPAAIGAEQRTYEAPDSGSVVYLEVIDGDTFRATILNWPGIVGDSISIRIANIDCLETRGKHDPAYRAKADSATAFARKKLENADVITLDSLRRGSRFRVVADVYVDGEDLGQMLVDEGLCRKCDKECRKARVYRTPSGSKYHIEGCQHLARSKTVTELSLEDALAADLTPCKVCKPPGFDNETP